MKSLGIQDASFHTQRHTAGSGAGQAGESGIMIARFLGHATATITERYIHLNPDHFKGIVSALDSAEQSAMAPQMAPQEKTGVEAGGAKVVR